MTPVKLQLDSLQFAIFDLSFRVVYKNSENNITVLRGINGFQAYIPGTPGTNSKCFLLFYVLGQTSPKYGRKEPKKMLEHIMQLFITFGIYWSYNDLKIWNLLVSFRDINDLSLLLPMIKELCKILKNNLLWLHFII